MQVHAIFSSNMADIPGVLDDSDINPPLLRSRIDSYPYEAPASKWSKEDLFCGHCQRCVSAKTFKRHCALCYSEDRTCWMTNEQLTAVESRVTGEGVTFI